MDARKAKLVDPKLRRRLGGNRTIFFWRVRTCRYFGYLRRRTAKHGYWYASLITIEGRMRSKRIAIADDVLPADGAEVMTFYQGLNEAENWFRASDTIAAPDHLSYQSIEPFPDIPPGPPYTVGNAVNDYLKWHRNRKTTTRSPFSLFKNHIIDQLGDIPLEELTPRIVTNWLHEVAQKPKIVSWGRKQGAKYGEPSDDPEWVRRRRRTANQVLCYLRAALYLALDLGYIDTDKGWRRVKPFQRVARLPNPQCIELNVVARLIEVCPSHVSDAVKAALVTGCRIGDLIKMRVGDYRRDVGRVRVPISKTGNLIYVSLSIEGIEFFERAVSGREEQEVLLADSEGLPWEDQRLRAEFRKYQVKAGIDPTVTFTNLRHTYASQAVMAGLPMKVVSTQLGHVNTRMVESVYGHLTDDYMTEEIRKAMPRLFT